MLQLNTLKDFFKLELGFRQSLNLSSNFIDPSSYLLTPLSELYIEDEHPLLILENLKAVAPFPYNYVENWIDTKAYIVDNIVNYEEKYYKCFVNDIGTTPGTDEAIWETVFYFSNWLEQKVEAANIKFWNDYYTYQAQKPVKKFFENKTLFDGAGSLNDTTQNEGVLKGFEFNLLKGVGIVAKINKIGIQLTEAANFEIKLFHDSQPEALETLNINYTTPNKLVFFDCEWILNYKTPTLSGGSFYVLYDQSELGTAEAINKVKDWSKRPCNCTRGEYQIYNLYSKTMNITPLESETNGGSLPDIENFNYNYTENAGLNFVISSYCDLTNFIIEQKDLFLSTLRKKIAIELIRELIFNANARVNRNEGSLNPELLTLFLDGDGSGRSGLIKEYNTNMKQLSIDLSSLDNSCLPCTRKGLRFGSIG